MNRDGINLIYHGDISIKISHDKYYYHNAGTSELFNLFNNCILGRNIANNDLPHYCMLYETDPATSITADKLSLNKTVKKDLVYRNNTNQVCLSFAIQYSDLLSDIDESLEYELQLFSQNGKKLASASISADSLKSITIGREALIEWYLYVSN